MWLLGLWLIHWCWEKGQAVKYTKGKWKMAPQPHQDVLALLWAAFSKGYLQKPLSPQLPLVNQVLS